MINEVNDMQEIEYFYKENVLRLNPIMEKCFPELMPKLKIDDIWTSKIGNVMKVKGFSYRKCYTGNVVCYVLESSDKHKTIYEYPCWALDKGLNNDN
jgi:hypothetical protein